MRESSVRLNIGPAMPRCHQAVSLVVISPSLTNQRPLAEC